MSSVIEIQSATQGLNLKERLELFRWLAAQEDIIAGQRATLLADLDLGLADVEKGDVIAGSALIEELSVRAKRAG
ncbi:MAG: hypothetical protein JWM35_802 [Verrucomicrobia bacterium]|nr:hypothetical protein [Verrucomicrobiota bacterium]